MSFENSETGLERSHETVLRARSYQTEMFERSMKGNAIVAVWDASFRYLCQKADRMQMDTGSGKTQMLVLTTAHI
jgi:hypothetical protein